MKTDESTEQRRFRANLFTAELGDTTAGSPFARIAPTSLKEAHALGRQVAVCIYEIAAELERKSDEVRARWAISPNAPERRVVVELGEDDSPSEAEGLLLQVLAELSIPVTNPK